MKLPAGVIHVPGACRHMHYASKDTRVRHEDIYSDYDTIENITKGEIICDVKRANSIGTGACALDILECTSDGRLIGRCSWDHKKYILPVLPETDPSEEPKAI
jgi:hypothetical protein